ncbi:wd40 repeat-containing protein smu1 [Anaeramoeba flamelloides]|uniref:Wd40 repeat-containing protein smu1 n=1 Tax=Anaeramoeba flamelloides TaxID=1746091 RepID=A0AAV8A920_9EUKA|nr:wd40 repeat-containing protein smu1 [Anaeramoeba flamelloides]
MQVSKGEVVKIVLQFLEENNLKKAKETLEKETGVCLNTVNSKEDLIHAIEDGYWSKVLSELSGVSLPSKIIIDLYEEIIIELLLLEENSIAEKLFQSFPIQKDLKELNQERFYRLKNYLDQELDPQKYFPRRSTRKSRREILAEKFRRATIKKKPSRLMELIQHSINYQREAGILTQSKGIFDLFAGSDKMRFDGNDQQSTIRLSKIIKFEEGDYPTCIEYSNCGNYLVSGTKKGFIEVWDPMNGELNSKLEYQKSNKFMRHETSISALCFTIDSKLLASGTSTGEIKIWHVASGKSLKIINLPDKKKITCLKFSKDRMKIVVSTIDGLLEIYGLKSGKCIKNFDGHKAKINSFIFTRDGKSLISCGDDCLIKMWKIKTSELTSCWGVDQKNDGNNGKNDKQDLKYVQKKINFIHLLPNTNTSSSTVSKLIISNDSQTLYLTSISGETLNRFIPSKIKNESFNFRLCSSSINGKTLYLVDNSNYLYSFNLSNGEFNRELKVHEWVSLDLKIHPNNNILVTCSEDSTIKIWKIFSNEQKIK